MSAQRRDRAKRIDTITALVIAKGFPGNTTSTICDEFSSVKSVESHPALNRRWLLQVLHSTRALDSCLKATTILGGCLPAQTNRRSLGGYLHALKNGPVNPPLTNTLPAASLTAYQGAIVGVRNKYMHEAGAYPATETEVGTLLSCMESCVVEVLRL